MEILNATVSNASGREASQLQLNPLVQRRLLALSSAKSPDFVVLEAGLWLAYSEVEKDTDYCVFFCYKRIIFANNIKSRSFYSNFDIAGRNAKHREQDYLHYGERDTFLKK